MRPLRFGRHKDRAGTRETAPFAKRSEQPMLAGFELTPTAPSDESRKRWAGRGCPRHAYFTHGVAVGPSELASGIRNQAHKLSPTGAMMVVRDTSPSTKPEPCRRARMDGRRVPLLADELPERQSRHRSPVGDEGEARVGPGKIAELVDRARLAAVDPDASYWAIATVARSLLNRRLRASTIT
jgi:hypothetical protein